MKISTWTKRLIITITFLALIATNILSLTHTAFNAVVSSLMGSGGICIRSFASSTNFNALTWQYRQYRFMDIGQLSFENMPGRTDSHLLPHPGGLVRLLCTIILILLSAVDRLWYQFSMGDAIAAQFIRHDLSGFAAMTSQ